MDYEKAVAVVGIGCKYPGANSPEELWRVLVNGENHVREVPPERWNNDFFYSADKQASGKTYCKHAGLIDDAFMWDNRFFGVNKREAEMMDPQQKLALEVSYRALENGGFSLQDIKGTDTAVYMGGMAHDYDNFVSGYGLDFMESHSAAGTTLAPLANRLSFFYDIHGPSVFVDTACSSGLVAINLGSNYILSGEGDIAICGGAGLILAPYGHVKLSRARMASAVGQCQAFSETADGYVRSEGCGVVILKNLQKAIADGDRIHCIITSCCNSDGGVVSPMLKPSSQIQGRLIRQVLDRAKLEANQIQFIEMHGTGTRVGDAVEVSGVGIVMAGQREELCPIGSIKTNIGHAETASAVAGLIKLLLMMQHQTMVPSVQFGSLKESLNFKQNGVYVLQEKKDWEVEEVKSMRVRIGALNSFGFAGTNGHAIIELPEQTHKNPIDTTGIQQPCPQLVMFTGADEISTRSSLNDTLGFLNGQEEISLESLAYTSCHRRSLFSHRVALPVKNLQELKENLEKVLKTKSEIGHNLSPKTTNTVFVFGGMATVWQNMGMSLYNAEPIYKETIDKLQNIFSTLSNGQLNLKQCIANPRDLLDPKFAQPSLFACQVALHKLWLDKGVHPNVILGHSVGEVAAAYASGHLSLDSAAHLIYHRGLALSQAPSGAMLVIGNMSIGRVQDILNRFHGCVTIAAYNSPSSCTVTGSTDDIDRLMTEIEATETPKPFLRKLNVNSAYHSQYMDHILPGFETSLSNLQFGPGLSKDKVTYISTSTGVQAQNDLLTTQYWSQNVRNSVQFTTALNKAIISERYNIIVEIGPKPALKTNIKEIVSQVDYHYLPTLTENKTSTFYQSWAKAFELDAVKRQTNCNHSVTPIPRHSFNKEYLHKIPEPANAFLNGLQSTLNNGHPFVNAKSIMEDGSLVCQGDISHKTTPFVYEHKLNGRIIVPGATYVEMAIASMSQMADSKFPYSALSNMSVQVSFKQPIYLPSQSSSIQTKIFLQQEALTDNKYYIDVTAEETLHATGRVTLNPPQENRKFQLNREQLKRTHTFTIEGDDFYSVLEKSNFSYGQSLRCISNISTDFKDAVTELQIPEKTDLRNTSLHPAVLDALLQSTAIFKTNNSTDAQFIPYGIHDVRVYSKLVHHMLAYSTLSQSSEDYFEIDTVLCNTDGRVLGEVRGIQIGVAGKHSHFDVDDCYLFSTWKTIEEQTEKDTSTTDKQWLVLTDSECTFPLESIQAQMHILRFDQDTINKIMEDEKILVDKLPHKLDSFSAIVYCVGLHHKPAESFSRNDMNSLVLKPNMVLVQLVKILNRMKSKILICVVTSYVYSLIQCQNIENIKIQTTPTLNALIGNTTTAMCRSIKRELPSFNLRTIDLDHVNQSNQTLLRRAISLDGRYTELVIHESQIKTRTLINAVHTEKRREIQIDRTNIALSKRNKDGLILLDSRINSHKAHKQNGKMLHSRAVLTNLGAETWQTHATAFDSIGVDDTGKKYHICKYQTIADSIQADKRNLLKYKYFPCMYPVLSYWLLVWDIFNKMNRKACCQSTSTSTGIALVIAGASPIWQHVVRAIGNLQGMSLDESSKNVLTIASELVDELVEKYKSKGNIFAISEHQCTNLAPESIEIIAGLETMIALQSNGIIQTKMKGFKRWLRKQNSSNVIREISQFETAMANICDIREPTDLTKGVKVPSQKHLLVDMTKEQSKAEIMTVRATAPKQLFKAKAGYVVIGGRKGLGLETIKYLINHGAKYIGIISRSRPTAENMKATELLEKQHGCQVVDLQADVSILAQLKEALDRFATTTGVPVKGVFYGAAITVDAIIPEMTKDKFEKVLPSKVAGVWNIYTLTQSMNLDLLVFYSSLTSMDGNHGQTNYGAGNGFKDAIACLCRAERGVGQSICFGPLDVGIVANQPSIRRKFISTGIEPLACSEINECLSYALMENTPIAGYSKFIWQRFSPVLTTNPIYKQIANRHCHYFKTKETDKTPSVTKGDDTQRLVIDVIKDTLLLSEEAIDLNATLIHIGADSQDRQMMFNILSDKVGFTENDMAMLEIGKFTVNEFIDEVSQLKAQYV